MNNDVTSLLSSMPATHTEGTFQVREWRGSRTCYVGRDESGCACILIKTVGVGRAVPLRLAGIEARFDVPCKVAEPGTSERMETLTVIICLSHEDGIEPYFASAAETLLGLLSPIPTTIEVAEIVHRLVNLFQKLKNPPVCSLLGLLGELLVIHAARDTIAAVSAWRSDPNGRYDFVHGRVRIDAKASGDRRRLHNLSFEQANPLGEVFAFLASVWVERAGGGISVGECLATIEAKLSGNHALILRLRTIVAESLGEDLLPALEWRFDFAVAVSSLAFFDMRKIPAIRQPLPIGVSGVRFVSNLESTSSLSIAEIASKIEFSETGIFPAD